MQPSKRLSVERLPSGKRIVRSGCWLRWLAIAALAPAAGLLDGWTADRFSGTGPTVSGQINTVIQSMRCWGDGATLVVVSLGLVLVQPGQWRALAGVLAIALLCAGMVDLAKPIVGRRRPSEAASPNGRWSIPWESSGGRNSSFPSGHTATAFSFARGLSLLYPPLRGLTIGAASGTALSRMADRRHYLSDCVAGALLGWFVTELLFFRYLQFAVRTAAAPAIHDPPRPSTFHRAREPAA